MKSDGKKVKGLGLCSGGLDSILAACVLRDQGIEVCWIAFETPFFSADKAQKASLQTEIPLKVVDLTERYLPMLRRPPCGYGRHMNPCMDCHALMFKAAGEMMAELGCDFLFSGEVMGQRPMSQTRQSLRYVEKHSGFDGHILRPLSAKKLPMTPMEESGLVDRHRLGDLSGRSRKPQMEMARHYGIREYPAPAGGCLLTDPQYSRRLKDYFTHQEQWSVAELNMLGFGRHLRLDHGAKLVVGRNKNDNEQIFSCHRPKMDLLIRMKDVPGPAGLVPGNADAEDTRQAASICAGYSKAPAGRPVEVLLFQPEGKSVLSVMPVAHTMIRDLFV